MLRLAGCGACTSVLLPRAAHSACGERASAQRGRTAGPAHSVAHSAGLDLCIQSAMSCATTPSSSESRILHTGSNRRRPEWCSVPRVCCCCGRPGPFRCGFRRERVRTRRIDGLRADRTTRADRTATIRSVSLRDRAQFLQIKLGSAGTTIKHQTTPDHYSKRIPRLRRAPRRSCASRLY